MSGSVESVFRVVAACTSLMMILSPTPAVYKIYKTKSIGNTNIVSLVSVFANCHVWTLHGLLTSNWFPVFSTFVSGDFISLPHLHVRLLAVHDRPQARVEGHRGVRGRALADHSVRGARRAGRALQPQQGPGGGYLAVCVTLVLYSSPFLKIKDVVKYKTGVFIPIHMLTVYMIYHPSKHPLGYGATLEDLLEKEKTDNNDTLSIAIDRASVQSTSKAVPQSPMYQIIKSPLAPLRP
ncbi:hypothetical protein PF005_g29780 [Phytophthora fragariae]|uniref:Uncharacterized protein n=1 Tax=Phytophthora fragariae TaxID=53985 RepID=A0A6A3GUH2_9STRA|nr:hypothetical protein PF003_g26631 [Phytophthora fragariae]KAE8919560.1 hypothetical protein PF009_g30136 [Phytophthora fragariae]KAE8960671.1 hypothetical protein PF011_g30015 [Phytophthora fragariae]KAE9062384.1 hypothetical protein PF010_g29426 [Phytophthora fragariae]KAE9063210.1 hypothetical protein PF007_g29628 [Phytophthora fragariae]